MAAYLGAALAIAASTAARPPTGKRWFNRHAAEPCKTSLSLRPDNDRQRGAPRFGARIPARRSNGRWQRAMVQRPLHRCSRRTFG
jgi:hypothetical protein